MGIATLTLQGTPCFSSPALPFCEVAEHCLLSWQNESLSTKAVSLPWVMEIFQAFPGYWF